MGKGRIDVRFQHNEIVVQCELRPECLSNEFEFSINRKLTIDKITDGVNELEWCIIKEWAPIYRSMCHLVKVSAQNEITVLHISYHGEIDGWCNVVQEDKIALSSYSGWYPQECNPRADIDIVNVFGCDDFFVLNADFCEDKYWIYGGRGYDTGNIIAMKNSHYHCMKNEELSFYFYLEEEKMVAEILDNHYSNICDYYYHKLFTPILQSKLDIVSLGLPEASGAYFRKELIVMAKIMNTPDNLSESLGALLAHEIAHVWCTGADTGSWEDWLNETTAEWSALLYAIERNDEKMFNNIIGFHTSRFIEMADDIIMTPNGDRPNSAHTKGTVLFHEIYKRYGKEVVAQLVSTFATLKIKDTQSYLDELRRINYVEVADIIEKGLSRKTFAELFV